MNPRTIRRAIERKAQKQARKEAKSLTTAADQLAAERETLTAEYEVQKATLLQLQANRRNAQLSTGPKSPEGQAIASRNALKTGLTGKTVLLPNDDAALYEQHVGSFRDELKPIGDREHALVQSIADTYWRLGRIPSLEFGIYALGRLQFAAEFAGHPPAEAAALIEAKTFLSYQRQLNNLSIQEARLRRQCEKDTAELARLQQLRAETERAKAKAEAKAATPSQSVPTEEIGFESSTLPSAADDLDFDLGLLKLPQAA